jgi:hypothetical protein
MCHSAILNDSTASMTHTQELTNPLKKQEAKRNYTVKLCSPFFKLWLLFPSWFRNCVMQIHEGFWVVPWQQVSSWAPTKGGNDHWNNHKPECYLLSPVVNTIPVWRSRKCILNTKMYHVMALDTSWSCDMCMPSHIFPYFPLPYCTLLGGSCNILQLWSNLRTSKCSFGLRF